MQTFEKTLHVQIFKHIVKMFLIGIFKAMILLICLLEMIL